jgi:hypothetical protein
MVFSPEAFSLEDAILSDNPVGFIDTFVEAVSLSTAGFRVQTIKSEGRPNFNINMFLTIYLYV